jgi:preprotein translocase subunit YajC
VEPVQFVFPLLLLVIFYLLIMRPARNRQREFAAIQASLEVGTVVMLASGVFGEIVHVGQETLRLRIAANTVITVHRQAVGKTLSPEDLEALRAEGSVVWEAV